MTQEAINNIFCTYSQDECNAFAYNIGSEWTCHILYSLAYINFGEISKVNDYFREIYKEQNYEFEEDQDDTSKEELMKRHIGFVVNYYFDDEEKDFIENTDFDNREEFNSLIKDHNLYDLVVLSEDGDQESIDKYFDNLWEENKN